MKALLKKASDWNYYKNIEINSLEDILKIDNRLIVETDKKILELEKKNNEIYNKDFDLIITIYDDYIE